MHSFLMVIPPFVTELDRRTHAAILSFYAGVTPPIPMFGRSLLYVQSHCVAKARAFIVSMIC